MDYEVSVSDIVSLIALAVSVYAIWTTSRFNKRQESLIDSQEKLNNRLLEQGESDALDAQKANVSARLVHIGGTKYRVRVFNKGKVPARSVRLSFPEPNRLIIESEVREKFPMEVLEVQQSVDLIASVTFQTPSKQKLLIEWSDDFSERNEKIVYLTR